MYEQQATTPREKKAETRERQPTDGEQTRKTRWGQRNRNIGTKKRAVFARILMEGLVYLYPYPLAPIRIKINIVAKTAEKKAST